LEINAANTKNNISESLKHRHIMDIILFYRIPGGTVICSILYPDWETKPTKQDPYRHTILITFHL